MSTLRAQPRRRSAQRAAAARARWHLRILMPGLPLQACSVLLSRGREHIVVDSGFPQHDTLLLDGLAAAGVSPQAVTAVINTHFHLDHCGCNFLFPQATIYGSRRDLDWAVSIYESVCGGETRREIFRQFYPEATDEEFDRMDQARLLQLLRWMWDPSVLGPRERYCWLEENPLPFPGLRLLATPGHTPGHISLLVAARDGDYLLAGDARPFADDTANNPQQDMPPWNHRLAARSRKRLQRFEGVVIPGHDDPFSQTGEAGELETADCLTAGSAGVVDRF